MLFYKRLIVRASVNYDRCGLSPLNQGLSNIIYVVLDFNLYSAVERGDPKSYTREKLVSSEFMKCRSGVGNAVVAAVAAAARGPAGVVGAGFEEGGGGCMLRRRNTDSFFMARTTA